MLKNLSVNNNTAHPPFLVFHLHSCHSPLTSFPCSPSTLRDSPMGDSHAQLTEEETDSAMSNDICERELGAERFVHLLLHLIRELGF